MPRPTCNSRCGKGPCQGCWPKAWPNPFRCARWCAARPERCCVPCSTTAARRLRPAAIAAGAVALLLWWAAAVAQPAAAPAPPASQSAEAARPRIGLVLSGGGARGLAHVGVLKVLEELRVPVDVIAGTSMGAIVGGLYASGLRAEVLERELLKVRWGEVFASRVERRQLSQRRKEEDFEISPLVELGWRDGELRTPSAAVSSRGLESLLRRYTLPVRDVDQFDRLPIAFRAVATDMETGAAVVLDRGDLALALRSSMSVPGVFSPTEVDGRVLGDGGLVNNVPVDVARALGADRVIVVNIGTPLAPRKSLESAVGLTSQMINILTEQNVQRSLATLGAQDVLISPPLPGLSSGDFDQTRAGHRARLDTPPRVVAVRIDGTTTTNPERLVAMLESQPGQVFDADRAERDTRRLAAGGDYTRADYQVVHGDGGDVLVFDLEDKPWGPHYLHVGLDLNTDFGGHSAFNLKVSHNRHWLTNNGTEWRNRVQIGEVPSVYTELYHPLLWTASRADDWFVAAYAGADRRRLRRFDADSGQEQAVFDLRQGQMGLDLGQPWGEFGEFRLGWSRLALRATPTLLSAGYSGLQATSQWTEDALRARVVVDQLDFATFPQSGYRALAEAWLGRRSGDLSGPFKRFEVEGTVVRSTGRQSFEAYVQLKRADQNTDTSVQRYSLGGFQRLSGYQPGQLVGNDLLLLRLGWYRRLSQAPTLTRGFFVGATLEAGNAWTQRSQVGFGHLRTGMSLFLGADTGIGPLYLGITHAPKGSTGLALAIGRP
ncbi:MAG: patatin [Burkholderiales bacterium PBB5]|nr:MAG: patatin [Burkholderiales bacterium PBB5]